MEAYQLEGARTPGQASGPKLGGKIFIDLGEEYLLGDPGFWGCKWGAFYF